VRIGDSELRNLVNGAISPFCGCYTRQNPPACKKKDPASFRCMVGRERKRDEGGRKRYGWTGEHFRVIRLRKVASSPSASARFC